MRKGYWLITYITYDGFHQRGRDMMKYKGFLADWVNKWRIYDNLKQSRVLLNAIQLDKAEYERLEI